MPNGRNDLSFQVQLLAALVAAFASLFGQTEVQAVDGMSQESRNTKNEAILEPPWFCLNSGPAGTLSKRPHPFSEPGSDKMQG